MTAPERQDESFATLRSLGMAEKDAKRFESALAFFRRALAQRPDHGVALLTAVCLANIGGAPAALQGLADLGLVPAEWPAHPALLDDKAFLDQVRPDHAVALFFMFDALKKNHLAARLGLKAWKEGTPQERQYLYARLPVVLLKCERRAEAGEVFLQSLAFGFPAADFRPKVQVGALGAHAPALAAALRAADGERYGKDLQILEERAAVAWRPIVDGDGVVLRAVSRADLDAAFFEIAAAGSESGRLRIDARAARAGAGRTLWTAAWREGRPETAYTCRLVSSAGESQDVEFCLPRRRAAAAAISGGEAVGAGGAVFYGAVSSVAAGARYRVEYGARADALDRSTAWKLVPPPRTARVRDLLYRQAGHWQPMSTSFALKPVQAGQGLPEGEGRLYLRFGGPFARDRNQLNGIGSHEMPLGFSWALDKPGLSVAAGEIDLKDAEISFVVRGAPLDQRGAALHFWISRGAEDQAGGFTSQWALTGSPFPDQALEDAAWHTVALTLPDDPRAWTYTGNNPEEQGARAARYRRLPLNETISGNNRGSVLIFAFGSDRTPPLGNLDLYAVSAAYRDHSVLCPAAGARLSEFPQTGVCDPLSLTGGVRGEDAALWTSGPHPEFPLRFTWRLPRPVTPAHFQINQHPYWPAREAEVWAIDAGGGETRLWAGVLPEGRAKTGEPLHLHVDLAPESRASPAVALRLRLLSAYHAARCGLDGFEVYGAGAQFSGDGAPCTVSEEVSGLTPGAAVFYRLVVDDAGGGGASGTAAMTLPATQSPILEAATPVIRRTGPECVMVRGNAMGLPTELWGEWIGPDGKAIIGERIPFGCQPTSRHIFYVPPAPRGTPGRLWLHARNAAGQATLEAGGWEA